MSYTAFLADSAAVRDRGDYLVELYPKNLSGVETVLRFSMRGSSTGVSSVTVGSDTIPAHTPFRRRLLSGPTFSQSLWQPGKILSRSIPSSGDIQLSNRDGGLDQYRLWTWQNCKFKIYFADTGNVSTTIGKVAEGLMSHPQFSIDTVTIPTLGKESLFDTPLSSRVYRGTSYMLELSGAKTADAGTPAAVNLTGSMTVEAWIWMDASGASNARNMGWYGGSRIPWALNLNVSTRTLAMRTHIGGVGEGADTVAAVPLQKPTHIACTISGRDVVFYFWDDDAQLLTTEAYTNYFSSATRDANVGCTLRLECTGTRVVWYDEVRVWNYARTATEIAADRFRPLTTVPSTCVLRWGMDDGTGTTVTDSSATAAHGTIAGAGTSTWLWAQEGGPELAGTPKNEVYGTRFGVAPTLVDPSRFGYQVAGGGALNNITSFEGGTQHTVTTAASFRAYLTTSPVAGLFSGNVSLRYLPRGLFKLGSTPTLPIATTVGGYNDGPLGFVNTGPTILRDIATRRGPKLTDPTDLDTSSFTTYGALSTSLGVCGISVPSSEQISKVNDLLMVSGGGWWGYKGGSLFHVERFNGPSATADFNFTQRKITSIVPIELEVVVYEVVVKYAKNDVVHTEDQVAAAIKGTANWTQWTMDWQKQPATDESLRSGTAISIEIETALQYQADARILADYLLSVLKGKKIGWSVSLISPGLQSVIAQTLTLLYVPFGSSTARIGLDGIVKYAILSIEFNPQDGVIKCDVWGLGS